MLFSDEMLSALSFIHPSSIEHLCVCHMLSLEVRTVPWIRYVLFSPKFMSGRELDKGASSYWVQRGGSCESACPEGPRKPCWYTVGPQHMPEECCWVKALDLRSRVLPRDEAQCSPVFKCFSVPISSANHPAQPASSLVKSSIQSFTRLLPIT